MEDCLDRDYDAAEAHFAQHTTAPYSQHTTAPYSQWQAANAAAQLHTTASYPAEYDYTIDRDYRHAIAAVAQTRTRRQELESAPDRDYRASALDLEQLRIRHTQAWPARPPIAAQAPAYPVDTENRDFAQAAADRASFHHLAELICTPDRHYNAAAVDLAHFRAQSVDRPNTDAAAVHTLASFAQARAANPMWQTSPTTASYPAEYDYAIDRDYRHAIAAVAQTRTRRQELESAPDRDYRASALDLEQLRIRHTQAWPARPPIAAQAPAYPVDTENRDFAQAAADRASFHHLAELICTPDRHYNAAAVDLARFRARPTADPAAALQVYYGKIRPTTQLDVKRACAELVPCTATRAEEGTAPGDVGWESKDRDYTSHDVDSDPGYDSLDAISSADPGYDSLDAISSADLLQRMHNVMASRVPTTQKYSTPCNATPPRASSIHGPHADMDCT